MVPRRAAGFINRSDPVVLEKYNALFPYDLFPEVASFFMQNLLRLDYEKILLQNTTVFRGDYRRF